MIILLSGHGPRRDFTDFWGACTRQAVSAEHCSLQEQAGSPIRRLARKCGRSGRLQSPFRRSVKKPAMDRVRAEPAGVVMLILCAGLAIEAILPWVVIWLSDVFLFDIPAWSCWLVFGAPPALGVLALGLYYAVGAGSRQLCPASITAGGRR